MTNRLRRLALKSPHPKYKHATLIFRGSVLVGFGYNHDGIHSESVALRMSGPSPRKRLIAVNVRVNRDGTFGMSKPCSGCLDMLKIWGVRLVKYTNQTGEWEIIRL